MMEAARTSEMFVQSNETARRYIPEDSKLPTRNYLSILLYSLLNFIFY